jgi:hypothetical protein
VPFSIEPIYRENEAERGSHRWHNLARAAIAVRASSARGLVIRPRAVTLGG